MPKRCGFYARRQAQYAALRDVPAVTQRRRQRITLSINAGLIVDLPHLPDSGADGIGLFRTELQFMMARADSRGLDQQAALYDAVLDRRRRPPVVFRTLDIGARQDRCPTCRQPREDNPALGWRAIRMASTGRPCCGCRCGPC